MKMRGTVSLILLCVTIVMAREGLDQTTGFAPAGVTIVSFDWRDNTHRQNWDRAGPDASQSSGVGKTASVNPVPAGSVGISGTRSDPSRDEPGVRVLSSGGRGSQTSGSSSTRHPSSLPPLGRKVVEYVYRVRLRNDEQKAIVAVDWEYQFLEPDTERELGHHRFESFGRVKPGSSRTLERSSVAPPAKVVSAAGLGRDGKSPYKERVVIRCVAYADGSVRWQDSGDKDDCERLKLLAQERRD